MIYIVVEGHGEVEAATKLVFKLWFDLGLPPNIVISKAIRWVNLHKDEGVRKAVEHIRNKSNVSGLLIIRDSEDDCPATLAPKIAGYIRSLNPPFPVAYHLMYREFETLFVAYLDEFEGKEIDHLVSGKLIFKEEINKPEDPESKRDAKSIIKTALSGSRSYKPTTDQATLVNALDIGILRGKQLPCFGTLERCLKHLSGSQGTGLIYPL